MKTKELLKRNKDVQEMKNFISWHIKPEDAPEDFVKKHFKTNEEALIKIQNEIESEYGRHVYLCEIVMYLMKYASKVVKKMVATEEEAPEPDEKLLAIDDSDHGCDPGFYEGD